MEELKHERIEYLMIRKLEGFHTDRRISFEGSKYDAAAVRILRDGICLGSFKLLPYSNGDVYFYDFRLFKEYRGHGLGTMLFLQIMNYLYSQKYKNIRLQVSSSNPAALALYRHFNFRVIESVTL